MFCDTCNLVGGYCGSCDGSHWVTVNTAPVQFVNCTPHALTIKGGDGSTTLPTSTTLPPSGTVARCATVRNPQPILGGFRVVSQSLGAVEGLPAPKEGTIYVVSALVLSALNGARCDVVAPDTGPDAVRENGQIKAVLGFVR